MTGDELLRFGAALLRAGFEEPADRTWPGGYHGAPVPEDETKPDDFDDDPTKPGAWEDEPTHPGRPPRSLTPSDLPALAYPCPEACDHLDCQAMRDADIEGRVMDQIEPDDEITVEIRPPRGGE